MRWNCDQILFHTILNMTQDPNQKIQYHIRFKILFKKWKAYLGIKEAAI